MRFKIKGMRMKYSFFLKVILAFLFPLIFISCSSTSAFPEGDWVLINYTKDGENISVMESTASFSLSGDSVELTGFSGVNVFSESLKIKGTSLYPEDFRSTKASASVAAMEFEEAFFTALKSADSWESILNRGTQRLLIRNSRTREELCFVPFTLADSFWHLISVSGSENQVSLINQPSVKFAADFSASVFTGINYVSMIYSADEKNHTLSFEEGLMTLASGPEKEALLEVQLLNSLYETAFYSVSGKNLVLYSSEKKELAVFEKD